MIPGLKRLLLTADLQRAHDAAEVYRLLHRHRSVFAPPDFPLEWISGVTTLFPHSEYGGKLHLYEYTEDPYHLLNQDPEHGLERHNRTHHWYADVNSIQSSYCSHNHLDWSLSPDPGRLPQSLEDARQRLREASRKDVCGHCMRKLNARIRQGKYHSYAQGAGLDAAVLWRPAQNPAELDAFLSCAPLLHTLYLRLRSEWGDLEKRARYRSVADQLNTPHYVVLDFWNKSAAPKRAHLPRDPANTDAGIVCGNPVAAIDSGYIGLCDPEVAATITKDICELCLQHFHSQGLLDMYA